MLPCVLHSERKRVTYPRLKVYSDLKYLPDFLRLENTSAIKSLQKKPIYIQKQGLAPRSVRRYTARNGSGSLLTHIVADGYTRYLYREVSPVNFNSQPKKMHRKQGACISKNALCLLTSKTSVVRDCAAQGAVIYGAEGISEFITDIPSETYMSDK